MTLIVQLTDLHLRPRGVPALRVSETNMMAERAVATVEAMTPRPDAVIITGDLTDKGTEQEYENLLGILERFSVPWYVIPGNHDSSPVLKRALATHSWASKSPADNLHFAVDIGPVRLIGLDTSVPGKAHGELDSPQIAWLDEELSAHGTQPTIVALHHPPIVTGIAHMDRTRLQDAAALEAILSRHDQVQRVICGHVHRPIFATFAGRPLTIGPGTAHQIVFNLEEGGPSAFNFEPPAFLVHKWSDASGFVTHMAYVEAFEGPYPFWPDKSVTWS